MKSLVLFLLLFNIGCIGFAQNFQLQISGNSAIENKIIDSLDYTKKHSNVKSINDEVTTLSEKLTTIGFIENQILESKKINDSSYIARFSLGEKIKSIHIYIGNNSTLKDLIPLDKKKDTLMLPYSETEPFMNRTLRQLEQKGFALAKLKLINIKKKNQMLYADLEFDSGKQRQLNEVVVKFETSNRATTFPKGHLIQLNKKYKNTTFNQNILNQIHADFEKFGFVSQLKYPEILFTKDTTKVYVYLEKRKSNTFDGFIGFFNNEKKKIVFNGYLDILLKNTLGAGEQFSVYWKSDGNSQKTFKAAIDLPYLFKSPFGIKAQLQIFKQDSTYQNTKTAIDLGYLINYNTRVYIGYQSTQSSDIQNANNSSLSDFTNSYFTSNLEYAEFDLSNSIFAKKSSVSLTAGIGKRETKNLPNSASKINQFYINLQAMHNFYLNKKNCININTQNYYLQSNSYITNELYRFGGINSIRGFAENSLQANLATSLLTEYRYILSPSLYIHSILDYGFYKDPFRIKGNTLLGIGFGLGVQTKNGLLKLALANGSVKNQEIKFYNTIVNISYKVEF